MARTKMSAVERAGGGSSSSSSRKRKTQNDELETSALKRLRAPRELEASFSPPELNLLRRAFHRVDADNSGSVSATELSHVLVRRFDEVARRVPREDRHSFEHIHPNKEVSNRSAALVADLDLNGDDEVDFEEFLVAVKEAKTSGLRRHSFIDAILTQRECKR